MLRFTGNIAVMAEIEKELGDMLTKINNIIVLKNTI